MPKVEIRKKSEARSPKSHAVGGAVLIRVSDFDLRHSDFVTTEMQGFCKSLMLPKYSVEYIAQFRRHAQPNHHSTEDPVACEEFVEELLERGYAIRAIKHEGVELPKHDFDRMVKTAAGMLASKRVCASLNIKADEEKFRFGFAA